MIRDRLEPVVDTAQWGFQWRPVGVPVLTRVRMRWPAVLWANRQLQLARNRQARGKLDDAAAHVYRALRALDGGPPTLLAAEVAYTTAQIECGRARYPRSAAHFECAALVLSALPPSGDRDRRLADVHIGLADVHRRTGRYAEASAALTAARKLAGGPDPAIVMLLGVVAKEQGRFGDAARHYGRLARTPLDPSDAATLHHNLAGLANAQYRYGVAERHARRALLLRRADPRATAVAVAADMAVLAAAVAGQHRHDEARRLFGRALAACRAAQPARHYEVAGYLHGLAGIEHDCGDLTAAEPLYREALAIKQRLLGPAHPGIALIMSNLAILLRDTGREHEAASYFRCALMITEHPAPGPARTVRTLQPIPVA
jgi:tetratricopeptide (TPR) repeat protein